MIMQNLVKGIGVDIADVKRFRKLPYGRNRFSYGKMFTDAEIHYCMTKQDPYPHFAARFAAKEAILKAAGKSIYTLKDIKITNAKTGAPIVKVSKKNEFLISLSHTKDYAIAFALWIN